MRGLFLSAFSLLDAFIGVLLQCVFAAKPDVLDAIQKPITLREIKGLRTLRDVRQSIITQEIDSFRRDSYVKQFDSLETRFGLSLKSYPNWPPFVETAMRRNLFAHADGIVSAQYLHVCRAEGLPHNLCSHAIGDPLPLTPHYLRDVLCLVYETGLRLGHSLWRKMAPDELDNSDVALIRTQYDLIAEERYELARAVGDFALQCSPHHSQVNSNILLINAAQTRKWQGQEDAAQALLQSRDWSSDMTDFRLAVAVLHDDYDKAAGLMRALGTKGELVTRDSYATWPLFKRFIATNHFRQAFKEIYGHDFSQQVRDQVNAAETATTKASQAELRPTHVAPRRRRQAPTPTT